MRAYTTKPDVEKAVEELAQMTHRSFLDIEKRMVTKDELLEFREQTSQNFSELGHDIKEDIAHLEDRLDAKLDKLIERFDKVIETFGQRVTILERQR